MPVEVLVGQASVQDAPLMAAIHARCFGRSWDAQTMETFVRGPGTVCLVGFVGDQAPMPAGLLIARAAADEAELLTLGVLPVCRRIGIGRALVREAATALEASGVAQLYLEVDESNSAAVALYRALGAKPAGRREGYYESGADAAIFSLDL